MAITKTNIVWTGINQQVKIAGVDIGSTKGGVEITLESEFYDIKVDQSLYPQYKKLIGRKARLKTQFSEATIEAIRIAWNLASSALVSSSLSLNNSEGGEVKLEFIGKGPGSTPCTRTYTFWSATAMSAAASHKYMNTEEMVIPVEFECNWNETKGEVGSCIDVAA